MVCNQSPGMIDWLLELGAARVARPVLRGGGGSDATSLPNQLLGVGFRVEPVVAHPAPPQTRTCAMNAYGSSGARVSALLWRITVLPCMAVRCCGRSWVWAGHTSPAAAETSPNGLGSCCYGDSASTATPSPHSGGPPPADGSSLGY